MRPIDADAIRARHISVARYFKAFENGKEFTKLIGVLVKRIDEAPTLDYAPVRHGSVIETNVNGKSHRVFSCCGTDFTTLTMWMIPIYCPNCGAKMDGGKKDET